MNSIDKLYIKMLNNIMQGATVEPRGFKCKETIGHVFRCDPYDNIITIPGLQTNTKYASEELNWYLSGSNRIDYSPLIKKIWERYSDDGSTVNSAYGHRIFGKHVDFCDQWEWVKQKLKEDPDSRQCVININYPGDKLRPTKDYPCTVYCQVFNRDDKLVWLTNMRSNDAYRGFRNDLYCFTELQKRMAEELSMRAGDYIHFTGSMHVYEEDFEKVNRAINEHA